MVRPFEPPPARARSHASLQPDRALERVRLVAEELVHVARRVGFRPPCSEEASRFEGPRSTRSGSSNSRTRLRNADIQWRLRPVRGDRSLAHLLGLRRLAVA